MVSSVVRSWVSLSLSLTLVSLATAQVEEDLQQVQETELEGTWDVVSLVGRGEQFDLPDGFLMRFVGNRMYHREGDDEDWTHVWTISLDPSAMPAEIDIGGEFMLGIYELDGDTLTFCIAATRPDRFESTEDNLTILRVLRRVEEDDE